jgi:hypothetical protein
MAVKPQAAWQAAKSLVWGRPLREPVLSEAEGSSLAQRSAGSAKRFVSEVSTPARVWKSAALTALPDKAETEP